MHASRIYAVLRRPPACAPLEKPALKGLTATQLNVLMGIAMTAVALIALAVKGPRLPMTNPTLGGLGMGVMIGSASVFYFLGTWDGGRD